MMSNLGIALLVLALTLIFPADANADSSQLYAHVSRLELDGQYVVLSVKRMDGGHGIINAGCSDLAFGNFFARSEFPISDERTKVLLQLAQTSISWWLKVHIGTVGCANGGNVGMPIIRRFQIQNE